VKNNDHNDPPSKPGPHTSKSNEHHGSLSNKDNGSTKYQSHATMINKDNGPPSKPYIAINDPVTNSIPKKVRVISTSPFFSPPSKPGLDTSMIKKDNDPSSKPSKKVRVIESNIKNGKIKKKTPKPEPFFAKKDPVNNSTSKKVMSTSTL